VIAAPLFHSWGFAHFSLGLALGSTLVLSRRFDPHQTMKTLAATQATALVVVPVMLQRILDQTQPADHDLSRLKIIAASGSALPTGLAERTMDAFGDILYNLYGSTEVAWVTVATPEDLRAAPGTAGRPPRGTHLRLLDPHDRPITTTGERGRIFAGNELVFDGYTGTGATAKRVVDGLMSTGDVGHLDADGRLFVDGREDEMIVSGAENVFPREVEDLLASDPRVAEAAVVGVPDPAFGQRLKAFVVRAPDNEDLDEAAIKALVRDQLAGFKVPREVVFLKALPRNATGKVVKRDLYP
jgi:fatty-acyl-CoA synthase